jgi:hypothetical protein
MGERKGKVKQGGRKPKPRSTIYGVVKARTCKHCGHHEMGIIMKSKKYLPLKPGMKIMILEDSQEK